ncbi:MAG: hypothetical protein FJW20_06015 [Acidimicrobiia bacterium]|nr:hypothetical protein [Acidimicrobiia bacterium]
MKIKPPETILTGKWLVQNGPAIGDETCQRIHDLVGAWLVQLGFDVSGWDTLFRDPSDGRYWERIYPQSHLHGGPPELRCLTEENALPGSRVELSCPLRLILRHSGAWCLYAASSSSRTLHW